MRMSYLKFCISNLCCFIKQIVSWRIDVSFILNHILHDVDLFDIFHPLLWNRVYWSKDGLGDWKPVALSGESEMYYKWTDTHVHIFTTHFTVFAAVRKQVKKLHELTALVYSKTEDHGKGVKHRLSLYLCDTICVNETYRQVSWNKMYWHFIVESLSKLTLFCSYLKFPNLTFHIHTLTQKFCNEQIFLWSTTDTNFFQQYIIYLNT